MKFYQFKKSESKSLANKYYYVHFDFIKTSFFCITHKETTAIPV